MKPSPNMRISQVSLRMLHPLRMLSGPSPWQSIGGGEWMFWSTTPAQAHLPLADTTADRIADILSVNVLGPGLLASAAIHHLSATRGAMVNVSSTFGHKPAAGLSYYAASKAALEHLTRCWALELAPLGVRVNAVAAGPTESGALTGMMGLSLEQAALIR